MAEMDRMDRMDRMEVGCRREDRSFGFLGGVHSAPSGTGFAALLQVQRTATFQQPM